MEKIGYCFVNRETTIDFCGVLEEWEEIVNNNNGSSFNFYVVCCQDGVVYASGECGENLTWTLDDTGTLTISGTGDMFDYTGSFYEDVAYNPWRKRPKKVIINEGVTSIGVYAFAYCINLKSVKIPDSVKTIGECAFEKCYKLQNVFIPDSVVEIGEHAFADCDALKGIVLSVETIGDYAFSNCDSLSVVVCAEGVKTIGDYAFYECENLSRITVGESVMRVDPDVFDFCHPEAVININENLLSCNFHLWSKGYNVTIYFAGTEEQLRRGVFRPQEPTGTAYCNSHLHEWSSEIESTCGYVTLTCEICGAKDGYEIAESTGEHNYIQNVTPETCTTHSVTDYECETCGYEYWDYTSNPTGRTFNEDGVCQDCGEKEAVNNSSTVNTQMLSFESILAMIMNLLSKLLGIFSVA